MPVPRLPLSAEIPITISWTQLSDWGARGSKTTALKAYQRIGDALNGLTARDKVQAPIHYLQGSYANDTNVFGNSDVDVIVEYEHSFYWRGLSEARQQRHREAIPEARYTWAQFRDDVFAQLRESFPPGTVTLGNKAIRIQIGFGKPADVLPAMTFRKYEWFESPEANQFTRGILFLDGEGNEIINYPALHIENGRGKQGRTRQHYKETIRVFKSLKKALVTDGLLDAAIAPSYFLECMLYNVPDSMFTYDLKTAVPAICSFALDTDPETFITQNGQDKLFGKASTQWTVQECHAFLRAAIDFWNG